MSAALNLEHEEDVQLSPEHQILFEVVKEIRSDLKLVAEKLEKHLGYHEGVQELKKKEEGTLGWFREIVSLLKARPWISVVMGITVVLLAYNGVLDIGMLIHQVLQ